MILPQQGLTTRRGRGKGDRAAPGSLHGLGRSSPATRHAGAAPADTVQVPGMTLPQLPWLVVLGLLALLLLVSIGWWRAATRLSRRSKIRQSRARQAERKAEQLLKQHRFRILERQATVTWRLEIDGVCEEVASRADLVVERDGLLWVADVKSGELAPDPRRPATRRQLLEYLLAFGVDGALVVDMSSRTIRTVAFPGLIAESRQR